MSPIALPRRHALIALSLGGAALLTGCATLGTLDAEVSSYGEWPAGRAPGSYAFERLPSQQARAADTEALEAAVRPALEKAGFTPAAEGRAPDVIVQVGARSTRTETSPWDDPLWWRGGFGTWRARPWGGVWGAPWYGPYGPGWRSTLYAPSPRFEREVALLLRDRESGRPLFEARAGSEGYSQLSGSIATALFDAALADFPKLGVNPRSVRVMLPR
jgi:hypothetical protein